MCLHGGGRDTPAPSTMRQHIGPVGVKGSGLTGPEALPSP